jgi:hypothetical protein
MTHTVRAPAPDPRGGVAAITAAAIFGAVAPLGQAAHGAGK